MKIKDDPSLPAGVIWGHNPNPEFVGVMPVRQDIEVIPADNPKNRKIGWIINETIGEIEYYKRKRRFKICA